MQHFHCSVHKTVQTVWRQAQKLLLQFVAMVRVTVPRLISVHVLPVVIRIRRWIKVQVNHKVHVPQQSSNAALMDHAKKNVNEARYENLIFTNKNVLRILETYTKLDYVKNFRINRFSYRKKYICWLSC